MVISLTSLIMSRDMLLWGTGIVTSLLLGAEIARFAFPSFNSRFLTLFRPFLREPESSHVTGSTYVLISSFIVFFIFPRDIAVIALSFLAVGDTASAVVGVAFAAQTPRGKNWQGSLACFLSNILTGLVLIRLFQLNVELAVLLAGAAIGTLVEALDLPRNDNITIPVSSALAMVLLRHFCG
jgi:dolichol kinase